ncbi:MAG: dihydrolipoamide acetyltransferase family protein [Spirochaetota bacterium]
MAEKVLMPALSPTMETGTILKWVKSEGEVVQSGDILCQVETDKATMEYEALNEGILLKIVVPEGGEVKVGKTIAIVGEKGEEISALLEDIYKENTSVAGSGKNIREEVRVGEVSYEKPPGGVKASPVARRIAKEHKLDLEVVEGSGPGGRIVKRDVELFIKTLPENKYMEAPKKAESGLEMLTTTTLPEGLKKVRVEPEKQEVRAEKSGKGMPTGLEIGGVSPPVLNRIPVSGIRMVIAKRLSQSKFTAPHYYLTTVVQVDSLFESRKVINAGLTDEKLSLNAFLIRFVAEALKRHPMVNAGWEGDSIVQFGSADIGIAVALPDGLIAPVVRDCWNKGILQIDRELRTLIDRALSKKLSPEEYAGATFTISNLGSYGIREFTAIINPPGSAILAVGEARKQPVVGEDDRILVKTNMSLTLSCDHRVIDGATGALFLKDLQGMIEDPVKALL